jgi:hypothetical protein
LFDGKPFKPIQARFSAKLAPGQRIGFADTLKRQFRAAAIIAGGIVLCSPDVPVPSNRTASIAKASGPSQLVTLSMTMPRAALSAAILLQGGSTFFSKSSAQVAPLVRPQVVSPKSCELKLGRQRPYRLMGRFSKEEKECVETKAIAAGLSVNEYIRATSLGPDYKPRPDRDLVLALLATNRELTAQGNNLNQIAKHMNNGTALPAEAEGMLGVLGRSLLQTHRAIRSALSQGWELPEP